MILLIDHYDSFVYNLARYIGLLGYGRQVVRQDSLDMEAIAAMAPEAIILSPGPCSPEEAKTSIALVKKFAGQIPLLGVCLGHQIIATAFGGRVIKADRPVHGQSAYVTHDGSELFTGLPSPFTAGRYHSLIVELPPQSPLKVTAYLKDSPMIMGLAHHTLPVYGIQFHPESILTDHGPALLRNFLTLATRWHDKQEAL